MSNLTITREIKIHSSLTDEVTPINTSATTWGELLEQLPSFQSGMKATALNTETKEKISLEYSSTKIPEKCIVFIMSGKKNDSGLDLNHLTYNELRKAIKNNNLSHLSGKSPNKEHLLGILNTHFTCQNIIENEVESKEQIQNDIQETIVEAKKPTNYFEDLISLKNKLTNFIVGLKTINININAETNEAEILTSSIVELTTKKESVLDQIETDDLSDEDIRFISQSI